MLHPGLEIEFGFRLLAGCADTQQRHHKAGDLHASGDDVPVPGAGIGGLDCFTQHVLALGYGILKPLPVADIGEHPGNDCLAGMRRRAASARAQPDPCVRARIAQRVFDIDGFHLAIGDRLDLARDFGPMIGMGTLEPDFTADLLGFVWQAQDFADFAQRRDTA